MRGWVWFYLGCALCGCGGQGASPRGNPADDVVAACGEGRQLAEQCPPGSMPALSAELVERCRGEADVELTDGTGAVTGICAREGSCVLACNFADPCDCGIDRITDEGVFCTSCQGAAACGDNVCEDGESARSCPLDCAQECTPAPEGEPPVQRCNGERREVCQLNGLWSSLACREDQFCEPFSGGAQRLTFCQTRLTPLGGGLPTLAPAPWRQEQTPAGDVAFFKGELTCAEARIERLDDGRLMSFDRRFSFLDLEGRACQPGPETGRALPILAASARRLAYLGDPVVEVLDLDSLGLRQLQRFIEDDYIELSFGQAAFGPGGGVLAADLGSQGVRGTVVWDAASGEVLHLFRYLDPDLMMDGLPVAQQLRFSHGGELLLEVRGTIVLLWNMAEGRFIYPIHTPRPVLEARFDPHGGPRLLLITSGQALVWDLEARRALWALEGSFTGGDIAPDGRTVALGQGDTVLLVDAEDGGELRRLNGGGAPLFFSADGRFLLAGASVFSNTL